MVDPKKLSSFAAVGFVLSFLFGLFSGVGFLHILLRAVIFAAVFAVLSILISFLEEKFLSLPQDLSISEGESSARPVTGGSVNITIDDDSLPDDDQGPQFTVSENRPSLGSEQLRSDSQRAPVQPQRPVQTKSEDLESVRMASEAPSAPPAEESVSESSVASPMQSVPAQESPAFQPVNLAQRESSSSPQNESDGGQLKELSDLPDIGSVSADSPVLTAGSEVISDSEFASEGQPVSPAKSFADGSSITTQNASVMAQAIRTILAKEN